MKCVPMRRSLPMPRRRLLFLHHVVGLNVDTGDEQNVANLRALAALQDDTASLLRMGSTRAQLEQARQRIDAAIEAAAQPLHGVRVFEAEMSDVLGDMAAQELGVAWLADSALQRLAGADLVPLPNRGWDIEVSILAYKDRADTRAAAQQLWDRMRASAQPA